MPNEDESVWLTFNGEIYNYQQLRRELVAAGHCFRSNSDSEVLVHGYEQWGTELVRRLNGIFAIGIFDCRDESLFLARDHVGVKPLYFSENSSGIAFASQPGALLAIQASEPRIDETALSLFLGFGYVPGPHCMFRGLSKLLPGHYLRWRDGRTEINRYWTLATKPEIFSESEAMEAVSETLADSVSSQLVSDVPVGVFVSGGIDSSAVAALASQATDQPLTAFTIGFDEKDADERPYARELTESLGINHVEDVLRAGDLWELLPGIVEAYDEPFFGGSAFPTYLVSRLAQNNGCKVILAGDGGDELFAGYKRYDWFTEAMAKSRSGSWWPWRHRQVSHAEATQTYFDFPTMAILKDQDRLKLLGWRNDHPDASPAHLLRQYYRDDLGPSAAARYMDLHVYLPDHILCKVDRASMANGVEVRVPFLNSRLVELSFQIDERILYHKNERKALLKKAISRHVPGALLTGRKKGFSIPLSEWMEREFSSWGRELVLNGSMVQRSLLDANAVAEIYDNRSSQFKWLLISLELWARRWLEGERPDESILRNHTRTVG